MGGPRQAADQRGIPVEQQRLITCIDERVHALAQHYRTSAPCRRDKLGYRNQ
jgi:hypothetical protein